MKQRNERKNHLYYTSTNHRTEDVRILQELWELLEDGC